MRSFVPVYAIERGIEQWQIGFLLSSQMVTSLLGPLVASPLIRCLGKFPVLIIVETIYALCILVNGLVGQHLTGGALYALFLGTRMVAVSW